MYCQGCLSQDHSYKQNVNNLNLDYNSATPLTPKTPKRAPKKRGADEMTNGEEGGSEQKKARSPKKSGKGKKSGEEDSIKAESGKEEAKVKAEA